MTFRHFFIHQQWNWGHMLWSPKMSVCMSVCDNRIIFDTVMTLTVFCWHFLVLTLQPRAFDGCFFIGDRIFDDSVMVFMIFVLFTMLCHYCIYLVFFISSRLVFTAGGCNSTPCFAIFIIKKEVSNENIPFFLFCLFICVQTLLII